MQCLLLVSCVAAICANSFSPHSTGSFASVSQFCNGLKSTKLIRYCLVTPINTFQHSQSFCQWCHWVIYCLGNKGPFINENMSSTFFSYFRNQDIPGISLWHILQQKIWFFKKSSLNIKEEIVHFFKSTELQHEKIDWEMYFCLDISMFTAPENSVLLAIQELYWCHSEHKNCFYQSNAS